MVEGASLPDIVADVRDVNPKFALAARKYFKRDRVVKILRVFRINGEAQLPPEIEPLPAFFLRDRAGNFPGFSNDIRWKTGWQ